MEMKLCNFTGTQTAKIWGGISLSSGNEFIQESLNA
jgi:hypothetical protein